MDEFEGLLALMAVAAVLILATGLGVLVYVVLPKHTDEVAFNPATVQKKLETARRDAKKDAVASSEIGQIQFSDLGGPVRQFLLHRQHEQRMRT